MEKRDVPETAQEPQAAAQPESAPFVFIPFTTLNKWGDDGICVYGVPVG